tara:strand:+ start:717 stop:959 length:243 start_codon:yes stop_codon:yes gene_type:complete
MKPFQIVLNFDVFWHLKNAERVVVDPSNFRNCEDPIGHTCRNRSGNPPTYPPTQSSDIKEITRILMDNLSLKRLANKYHT